MPPSDSKAKIRPQQSCLKCRERKVKCDRLVPCHACIIRGIEAECTYLTTAEDRAHINQAEIIERLRREVAQLRNQLSQGRPSPSPSPRSQYARAYTGHSPSPSNYGAGAGTGYSAGGSADGGSWSGSSPSSTTTMTNSVTVTSPGSTGSENGMQMQSYPVQGQFGAQSVEMDVAMVGEAGLGVYTSDEATILQCQAGSVAFGPGEMQGSMSMHGLPQSMPEGVGLYPSMQMYGGDNPSYMVKDEDQVYPYVAGHDNYMDHYKEYSTNDVQRSHAYQQQWGHDAGHQYPPTHAHPNSSYYSSSSLGALSNDPHAQLPSSHSLPQNAPTRIPSEESFRASPFEAIPSSWKGEGKQELLQTILRTIGSCDEEQVDQVVQVVRSSATPEDAVLGICQILGIGAQ